MPIDDILDSSEFGTKDVPICLRQDLVSERKRLEEKLLQYRIDSGKTRNNRLGAAPPDETEIEINNEIMGLNERIEAATLTFHMTAIPSAEYNVLQRMSGKPREGVPGDKQVGFNLANFYNNAIPRCTIRVVAPDGDERPFSEGDWKKLFDRLNDVQYDSLAAAVTELNRSAEAKNPTMGRTSDLPPSSTPKSEPQPDSESAASDSQDGNPPPPPQ